MREIKFRAWHKEIKRMGIVEVLSQHAAWVCGEHINFDYPLFELELMQYTGINDKNGREIYEGDIVVQYGIDWDKIDLDSMEYEDYPQKVVMTDVVSLERFRYWLKNEKWGYEGEELIDPEECEVIGNIYENPELLE